MRPYFVAFSLCVALLAGPGAAQADAALDPLRTVQWALDAIHLGGSSGQASAGAPAGAGALVAVIDSGVDAAHPDLAGRVVAGPDLVGRDALPADEHGHGTHIAGIIAASSGNGLGGEGIAPQARILAIRVLDRNNNGTTTGLADGIHAAVDAGADVINLSLNWSQRSGAVAQVTAAMRRATDAGIAVIVAAGNGNEDRCEEPILPQRALCVGALDDQLRLAPFSSHGHGLGILAPGENVISTSLNGDYLGRTGTSQAAAVASGVAALLVGEGLRGSAVVQRLVTTARDIGPAGIDAASGFGMLDAQRALDGAAEGRMPVMLRVGARERVRASSVRSRGLRVACDAARAGICKVRVLAGGRLVARGSAVTDGSGPVTLRARPTRAARSLLTGRRSLDATVEAAMSGVAGARRPLRLLGA